MRDVAPACLIALVGAMPAKAEAPTSPGGAKPTFTPGLYESESRSSASPDRGVKSIRCIPFADVDAFRRGTIANFLQSPQFKTVCRLSDPRPVAGGFAFAMDCDQARTITTYTFAKDLVTTTTRTQILPRPEYSSTILTLSRRIGACPARKPDSKT